MAKIPIVGESKNPHHKSSNRTKVRGRSTDNFVKAVNPFIDDKQLGEI